MIICYERRKNMKQRYEELKLEVITFDAEDVITTSIPEENETGMNQDF